MLNSFLAWRGWPRKLLGVFSPAANSTKTVTDMDPIKRIAFVVNDSKVGAASLAEKLQKIAAESGVEILRTSSFSVERGFLEGADACCVIGGDGTFLSVAVESGREQVPLVGVNLGTLGFLTTFASDEAAGLFSRVLNGEYNLSYRSMLDCQIFEGHSDFALNDVVVKAKENAIILHVNVFADDEFITTYVCDGLIFSTPTGSTAYTLSAGGPMVHPMSEVISLTPICAHTLSNRSIIFPESVSLRVENAEKNEPLLVAMDGQRNLATSGGSIRIKKAERSLPIAQKLDYSHFKVVRRKLMWNGGYKGEL